MALSPGTRLGVYEVTAPIGEGGMGQVYRAHDAKLDRDVAIKILPDTFAHDADRLARFQREARTLASLNHPNIAIVHGLEQADGVQALVMELVDGEDLSVRIARGAIPLDEALPIARQIADALDAAHGQSVVHRDLKPANIKVRPDGTVKVLDFGLAKAMEPTGAISSSASQSPTLTTPAMTQAGMILGTAAYMSPEQARGKSADKRADIWAFGVILFEALTGRRLFAGDEVSDTLAFVLTKEPDWSLLPAGTPPSIVRLLRRCLQKDRSRRLADIADARIEIDDALAAPGGESGAVVATAAPRPPVWKRALPWVVAGAAVVLAVVTIGRAAAGRTTAPQGPIRVRADLGTAALLASRPGAVAFSPDGTSVAFTAGPSGEIGTANLLYVRRLSELDATPLPGTVGAAAPFFSPDGQWIGFVADGLLKKVSTNGGAAAALGEKALEGAWWGDDDTIVFRASTGGLMRVAAGGGRATPITQAGENESEPRWPQLLPGGQGVLYTVLGSGNVNTVVARRLPDGDPKPIVPGAYYGRYLPSGHLTYLQNGTLFAVPFDLDSLEPRGTGVPIVESLAGNAVLGGASVSASGSGALVYAPATGVQDSPGPLLWLDQAGTTHPLRATPSRWAQPRFSPDGHRLALTISDAGQDDIWVYDWERDILTRITSDPATDACPVWTPDGTRIIFASNRNGTAGNLYWQNSDGTGEAHRLTTSATPQLPDSVHPSGRFLAFHEGNPFAGQQSLALLPLDTDATGDLKPGTPQTFVGGPFLKALAMFSPDGHWLAYAANESGRFEIYVQPFPGPGARVQVSSGGGNRPMWSRTGREIFYSAVSEQERMMVVAYSIVGETFVPDKPRVWSEARFSGVPPYRYYGPGVDVHPDGKRFVVAPAAAPEADNRRQSQLVFIFNFFDDLRRRVLVGR